MLEDFSKMDHTVLDELIKEGYNNKISGRHKDPDVSSMFCKTNSVDVDGLPPATHGDHVGK